MIIETLYTMLDSLCFRRFLLQSYVNFGIIVEFGYGKEPQPFIILFKITCTGPGILEEKVKKIFLSKTELCQVWFILVQLFCRRRKNVKCLKGKNSRSKYCRLSSLESLQLR